MSVDRVVLLDRDGVLNVDLPNSLLSINDLQMIDGAAEAVASLNKCGFRTMVVTNQACVGRNQLSHEDLEAIHREISEQISRSGGVIDDWFVCAHTPESACNCRKPLPGLLLEASRKYAFDLANTWFVGDSGRDIEAAISAGAKPALVLTGKGRETALQFPNIPVFNNLGEFSRYLIEKHSNFFVQT